VKRGGRTIPSLRSQLGELGDPALRRIRLTARFVRAALVRVPLYGFGGAGALFAIALLYSRSTADEGLLAAVGDTSILVLYPVLGFVGGSLLGGAAAVRDTLDFFERQLPRWFEEVAVLVPDPFPSMPLAQLRSHHDRALDQMIASSVGAVRAPGLVQRAIRRRLTDDRIQDFLDFCESRGATEVGFPEARAWMVARGFPLLTAPTRRQVMLVQVGVWCAMALLAVLPFVVSAVAS
jgi:hypothetical protein